jgi:nucleoside permease NupC
MARNSFVFYKSFFEAIKELEDKDKGIISYAIMQYGLTGELPNLTGYLKSMFLLIKPQIDANNKKYENGRKGADFGSLGGRPKTPR